MQETFNFEEHIHIDHETLREVAEDESVVRDHVEHLLGRANKTDSPEEKSQYLGEAGVFSRIIGNLEQAEQLLAQSGQLVEQNALGVRASLVVGTRIAHVWQWQKKFEQSNRMFEKLLETCMTYDECRGHLDFVYQHHGKNVFDQGEYSRALALFKKAYELRKTKGDRGLLASTEIAIRRTLELV